MRPQPTQVQMLLAHITHAKFGAWLPSRGLYSSWYLPLRLAFCFSSNHAQTVHIHTAVIPLTVHHGTHSFGAALEPEQLRWQSPS